MKNALRLLSLMLALIMSFSVMLTACGPQSEPETTPTEAETQPTETEPTVAPTEEYTEPLVDGYNQVTFYWSYPGTYENCDMWIWWGDVAGKGYLFHECEYGAKVVVNVPEDVEEVGFIVRRDCSEPGGSSWGSATKDYEQDRFAIIDGRETVIYLKSGDASQYTSNDGGKTLTMIKKFALAGIVDQNKIKYSLTPKTTISSLDKVKVREGDREIKIKSISTLGQSATTGYIEVEETLDLSKNSAQKPLFPPIFSTASILLTITTTTEPISAQPSKATIPYSSSGRRRHQKSFLTSLPQVTTLTHIKR
jgi:hypothetical protein